jgi:hypothetical protein
MCALEESLTGLGFNKLDHYVGVSAGGFIVAALAIGMPPRELCASFIENDSEPSEAFDPAWLPNPAYGEFLRDGISLNHAVLDDPKRHLSAPPRAPTRIGRAIATLQEVMDDLGETVATASRRAAH